MQNEILLTLTVPLTPVPAIRPRVTRWGTYYGKRYKEWRAQSADLVPPSTLSLALPMRAEVLFSIPRSKTGRLATPVGDGDNYEKAIYDLIQSKGYIEDDRWITSATWRKRFVAHGLAGYTTIILTPDNEEIEL